MNSGDRDAVFPGNTGHRTVFGKPGYDFALDSVRDVAVLFDNVSGRITVFLAVLTKDAVFFDFDKDGFACIGGNIWDSDGLEAVIDKVVGLAIRADVELSQGYAHNHILAPVSGASAADEIKARVFNIEEFFNIISVEVHRDQLSILMRIVEDDFKFDSEAYGPLFYTIKTKNSYQWTIDVHQ